LRTRRTSGRLAERAGDFEPDHRAVAQRLASRPRQANFVEQSELLEAHDELPNRLLLTAEPAQPQLVASRTGSRLRAAAGTGPRAGARLIGGCENEFAQHQVVSRQRGDAGHQDAPVRLIDQGFGTAARRVRLGELPGDLRRLRADLYDLRLRLHELVGDRCGAILPEHDSRAGARGEDEARPSDQRQHPDAQAAAEPLGLKTRRRDEIDSTHLP
jgi:hypothetical protein